MDTDREGIRDALVDLESRLNHSTRELMKAELEDEVQVSIVRELLCGERTLAEMVEAIFSVRQGDEGFRTSYTRVRREVENLEVKGFVSRRVFGRGKPYHLTQLAVIRLTKLAHTRPGWSSELVGKSDIVLYTATLCLLAAYSWASFSLDSGSDPSLLILLVSSLFCGGMAFLRFLETLMKVI